MLRATDMKKKIMKGWCKNFTEYTISETHKVAKREECVDIDSGYCNLKELKKESWLLKIETEKHL